MKNENVKNTKNLFDVVSEKELIEFIRIVETYALTQEEALINLIGERELAILYKIGNDEDVYEQFCDFVNGSLTEEEIRSMEEAEEIFDEGHGEESEEQSKEELSPEDEKALKDLMGSLSGAQQSSTIDEEKLNNAKTPKDYKGIEMVDEAKARAYALVESIKILKQAGLDSNSAVGLAVDQSNKAHEERMIKLGAVQQKKQGLM